MNTGSYLQGKGCLALMRNSLAYSGRRRASATLGANEANSSVTTKVEEKVQFWLSTDLRWTKEGKGVVRLGNSWRRTLRGEKNKVSHHRQARKFKCSVVGGEGGYGGRKGDRRKKNGATGRKPYKEMGMGMENLSFILLFFVVFCV